MILDLRFTVYCLGFEFLILIWILDRESNNFSLPKVCFSKSIYSFLKD